MVLMTCCGKRYPDVRASMNHECEVQPENLRAGDLGYNGDAEGHWVVVAVTANWIHLETQDGADVLPIPVAESREQDWRWFREGKPVEQAEGLVNAVARAVSKAIEEAIEQHSQFLSDSMGNLLHGGDGAIYLLGDDGMLRNSTNGISSEFTMVLSDGQEFAITVKRQIED